MGTYASKQATNCGIRWSKSPVWEAFVTCSDYSQYEKKFAKADRGNYSEQPRHRHPCFPILLSLSLVFPEFLGSKQLAMKKTKPASRKRTRMTGDCSTRRQAHRRLERLESRAMLAADISPWHNAALPGDVDGDGQVTMADVELLVGELRATGNRALGGTSQAMGGMEGESPFYLDVTNDGTIDPSDLTQLANMLIMEGEDSDEPVLQARPAAPEYSAQFEFFIYDASGTEILAENDETAELNVGDFFTFWVTVANTSDDTSGILSAFIDVTFDPTLVAVVDPEGEELGPGFSSNVPTNAGWPNNIVPGDSTGDGVNGWLRAMGGLGDPIVPPGADGSPVKLFSLQFQVIAAGELNFQAGYPNEDPSLPPDLYEVENPDQPGEFYTQVSYEPFYTDGSPAGLNLTATTFVEDGAPDGDIRDIATFSQPMIVSLSISDEPVFGANPDTYQVGQDFDQTLTDEDLPQEIPQIVTIDGIEYAVLDVLANDGDETGTALDPPRDRFTITGIDTSININLEDAAALEERLLIIDIDDPDYAAAIAELGMDFSHQVILYQVPEGLASPPPEVFRYTIDFTDPEDNPDDEPFSDIATVTINVIPAPQFTLIAGDLNLTDDDAVDQGDVIEFNIFDLVTATGEPDEGEELTFEGFIGTEDLEGTFVDLALEEGYGPGWFRYIAPDMAQIESFQYEVSFAGMVETGTITIETLSNTRILGMVYFDVNGDGVWNDNAGNNASPEQRIGGVEVQLLQGGVAVGDPVYTNARGEFDFRQMDPGTYSVQITDPRFVIKGLNSDGNLTNIIEDIELVEGVSEQALDLSFGFRGRQSKYRGFGDFLGSNTEDSIVFAMSKNGGETNLEWYSVDRGWDRLVEIRHDLVFYDAAAGFGQIAFDVTVEGQDEPVLVVHTFSTSSPDFMLLAETNEGLVFRFSGAAADVLTNLAAVDEAYVDY